MPRTSFIPTARVLALFLLFSGLAGCDLLEDTLGNEKEVQGTVEAISDSALTVDGIAYRVTSSTEYEGISGLGNLSVGDEVEIEYEEHGGSRRALEIERLSDGSDRPGLDITYDPPFDPSSLQTSVTNPYFPLTPGTVWAYEGETEDGTERIVVEVLEETRDVVGVAATVVRDRAYLDGELIEDTFDWFAQDADGNVWYLGEATEEIEDGEVVSTAGSWEAGVDGAEAGVLMPAEPTVGQA